MPRSGDRESRHCPPTARITGKAGPFKRWEEWEEELILSLRAEGKTYRQISQLLPDRTEDACMAWVARTFKASTMPNYQKRWEDWEDELILARRKAGCSHHEISESLSHRTTFAVKHRWNEVLKSRTKATIPAPTDIRFPRRWTLREDQLLKSLRRSGQRWTQIAKNFPDCTVKQCIVRGHHVLHPQRTKSWTECEERYKEMDGIKDSSYRRISNIWSAHERDTLIALHNTIGPRWEEIWKHIPGRTEAACEAYHRKNCTKEDGVGDAPSEYWQNYFMSKLHTKSTKPAPNPDLTH